MGTPALLGGRFRVERLAGEGGMGSVYRCEDNVDGATVAVKVVRAGSGAPLERFLREAEVLRRLAHPSIVRYVAHGCQGGQELWLAMEWLEGEDLEQRLRLGPLTVTESVEVAAQLAEALDFAHEHKVVHRDLKPANLFLAGGDLRALRVLDFGIARVLDASKHTRTGALLSSLGYASPEQVRGARDLDARTDLFALGCILYECLSGARAFDGEQSVAILARILLEEPTPLRDLAPHVPEPLASLVHELLRKDPAERPPSAARVLERLQLLRASLAEGQPSLRPPRGIAVSDAERRYATVLLASVPEAEDPNLAATRDSAEVRWTRASAELLEGLGGRVEVLSEDLLVALFAQGATLQDSAVHAASAALALRGAHPELSCTLASGVASVGGTRSSGNAFERAARRHRDGDATAEVRVDAWTAKLLQGRFALQGEGESLQLLERADVGRGTLVTPGGAMVGRERELAWLTSAWSAVAEGLEPAVLLVTAPAGVGKSRLLEAFLEQLRGADPPPKVWTCAGDPLREGVPFALLRQLLSGALAPAAGQRYREDLAAQQPLAAAVLGALQGFELRDAERQLVATVRGDPQRWVSAVQSALAVLLELATAEVPVLLLLEDLHWGDAPTVSALLAALPAMAGRPLLLLAFSRPEAREKQSQLFEHPAAQVLRLTPLSRRASEQLARARLGAAASAEQVQQVAARAEGHPLLLEELARQAVEGGAAGDSVLAVVQARVSVLQPEERRALRAASVLGELFWVGGVAALLGRPEGDESLAQQLASLERREFLAPAPASRYEGQRALRFRHALVRDATYAMLDEEDRRLAHRAAAVWLERAGETEPQVLARHYDLAACDDASRLLAAQWWQRAAAREATNLAMSASLGCVRNALAHLERVTPGSERDEREFALRCLESSAAAAQEGLQAASAAAAQARALTLGEALGKGAELMPLLVGRYGHHLIRGEYAEARRYADRLRARESPELPAATRIQLLRPLWNVAFYQGHFAEGLEAARRGLELYGPTDRGGAEVLFVVDAISNALAKGAVCARFQGALGESARLQGELCARVERIDHAYTTAVVAQYVVMLALDRGEADLAESWALRGLSLSERWGFELYRVGALGYLALVRAARGEHERARRELLECVKLYRERSILIAHGWLGANIVRASRCLGEPERALEEAAHFLSVARASGEGVWMPQLHRERARCLRVLGREAERSEALEDAWRSAESTEAGTSLARAVALGLELADSPEERERWSARGRAVLARWPEVEGLAEG